MSTIRNQRDPALSPDDVAQEMEDRLAAERTASIKQQRDEDDLKWVLADKRGRRVMASLLAMTGLYQGSFTGSSETFFREGRRDIGLQILSRINNANPDAYITMLKERE